MRSPTAFPPKLRRECIGLAILFLDMAIRRLPLLVALVFAGCVSISETIGSITLPERIWISESDWQSRLERIRRTDLLKLAEDSSRVLQVTQDLSPSDLPISSPSMRQRVELRLEALTVRAACWDDKNAAVEALGWVDKILCETEGSDLSHAAMARQCAIAYGFCRHLWPEEETRRLRQAFYVYGLNLQEINKGNPDNPFNNWWGVTHSAAGMCYLIAQQDNPEAVVELYKEKERVESYLLNYGEAGHYYEGNGYGIYSFSFWGPFLFACQSAGLEDPFRYAPGARKVGSCMSFLSTAVEKTSNYGEKRTTSVGSRVFWNDDNGSYAQSSVASLFFPITPLEDTSLIRSTYDRFCGVKGDGSWLRISGRHGHALWTLLYYPIDQPAPAYGEASPLVWIDRKCGLVAFRNRYQDQDDIVFAVYAKSFHGGGHQHSDAGSFRLLGLGKSWAHSGGQGKPAAKLQNVLLRNGSQGSNGHLSKQHLGKISYFAPNPHGGSVSVELDSVYSVARMRRNFVIRFTNDSDAEAIVACWDEIVDSPDQVSDWSWSLCFERGVEATVSAEDSDFKLVDPQFGSSMTGHFGVPELIRTADHQSEKSTRTFSDGSTRSYPPANYLLTDSKPMSRGNFFTVMTLQKGPAPSVRFDGHGKHRRAIVADRYDVWLETSKWYQGPLRISTIGLTADPAQQ